MGEYKVTYRVSNPEQWRGEEPWDDIRVDFFDFVEADSEEEAIDIAIQIMVDDRETPDVETDYQTYICFLDYDGGLLGAVDGLQAEKIE